jgi:hypothetical protein
VVREKRITTYMAMTISLEYVQEKGAKIRSQTGAGLLIHHSGSALP